MNIVSNPPPFAVFLDIDGVLTKKAYGQLPMTLEERTVAAGFFDTDSLNNLDYIIQALKSTRKVWVVISSFWRIGFNVEELKTNFSRHKFSEYIFDKTIDTEEFSSLTQQEYCDEKSHKENDVKCRAREIQLWLKNHPEVIDYLILDDVDDHLSYKFGKNYVKIDQWKLITKGIKNYIISDLCGKIVSPLEKEKINLAQKNRINDAIALPKGMPSVMKFYIYENELNRRNVNLTVANDISQVWASFLNKESRQAILEGGLILNEIQSYPTDLQVNAFKTFIADKIYSCLENEKNCSFHLKKEEFWTLSGGAIFEAFESSGISANQFQNHLDYFPFCFSTHVCHDKDGIGIGMDLRDSKPKPLTRFTLNERSFALNYHPSYESIKNVFSTNQEKVQ